MTIRNCNANERTLSLEALEPRRMLAASFEVLSNVDLPLSHPDFENVQTLRWAITQADKSSNPENDEILFGPNFYNNNPGGTIFLQQPITISNPVRITPFGADVIIKPAAGFSGGLHALKLTPRITQGDSSDYEIKRLNIDGFDYGILVDESGSNTPDATAEGVIIDNNVIEDTLRGIFYDNSARTRFEIRNNEIYGRATSATPGVGTDAGIWIEETISTVTNSFSSEIDSNFIGNFDGSGILVFEARLPNLSITNNTIGRTSQFVDAPNDVGIFLQGYDAGNNGLTPQPQVGDITGNNRIVNNYLFGIGMVDSDQVLIDNNEFQGNDTAIGMFTDADDNTISNNDFIDNISFTVAIGDNTTDSSLRNRVTNNLFRNNGGLPIDLGSNGIQELNDLDDIDNGSPNNLQNYPVLIESGIVDVR